MEVDSFATHTCTQHTLAVSWTIFFRANGAKIRDVAMMVAPLLAPENPALASAVGVVGQGAASYSQPRDRLDQAS